MISKPGPLSLSLVLLGLCLVLAGPGSPAWAAHPGASTSSDRSDSSVPNPDPKPEEPSALYYDFDDVLIPKQLELKRDKSFVYDTASFTAGVLTFEGSVEIRSLTRFFIDAMNQDNWLLGAKFTHQEVFLLFEKTNKRAIIQITETRFKTHARIWVAPFLGARK
jgi:hypothetical protein